MHSLYYVAIILFSGILMSKIVSKIKLPNVTGYLLAGVLIGPYVLGLVPKDAAKGFSIISEAALGFIAYGIGSEFNFEHIKRTGKTVIWITVLESVFAVLIVDFVMIFLFKQDVAFSIVLGAIAAATAPAATILVVRQYKAKGEFTSTLLQVVAMDDAVGIIAFGISMAIADEITGNKNSSLLLSILQPVWQIVLAAIIGVLIGAAYVFIAKKVRGEDELLTIAIAIVFFAIGVSVKLNISTLLTCMAIGATVTNIAPNGNKLLSIVDKFTPPLFVAFFTVAGVELNLSILKSVGVIGIGYMVFRVVGKMLGTYMGASISGAPDKIKKYLGFALVPQAGVAIGLSMIAEQTIPSYGTQIRTIILAATVIYELIGPLMTKTAIKNAGEIPDGVEV